jgi:hypothetical protein
VWIEFTQAKKLDEQKILQKIEGGPAIQKGISVNGPGYGIRYFPT